MNRVGRKIELTEEDFLLLVDVKKTLESMVHDTLGIMNEVLARHTVRDPEWKGHVVPFETKKLKIEEKGR